MSTQIKKSSLIALAASLLLSAFGCASTDTGGWEPAPQRGTCPGDAIYVCWGGTGSKARKKVADPEPRICECRPRHEFEH